MSSSKDTFDYNGRPVVLLRNLRLAVKSDPLGGVCGLCPVVLTNGGKSAKRCDSMRSLAECNSVGECGPGATAHHWDFYVYSDDDSAPRAILAGDLIRG